MQIQIKKLDDSAIIPSYAHETDAGMDLYAIEEVTLAPGDSQAVGTGIAMAIPAGYVGLIWDKSGIAAKHTIKTMAGVVDSDYRGELKVVLVNLGKEEKTFNQGDKIAQMLIQKVEHPDLTEVENLDDTQRGEGGFGSTGA